MTTTKMRANTSLPSSFRDPSGFLFYHDGSLYRQVNAVYQKDFDKLVGSGLYDVLVQKKLLIPHEEVDVERGEFEGAYRVLKPEMLPFISYPYEWCFSQLKEAALLTLKVQRKALEFGMSLKDASAYNVQFRGCQPILIDTLSFEEYLEGRPWVAYRQFCQHFLAPLALMAYTDVRLGQLLRVYIDGIPLDLASSLLPSRTRFKFSLLSHIHLHAKSQRRFADKVQDVDGREMTRVAFLALIDNLDSAVKKLMWQVEGCEWADYYGQTNYSKDGFEHKKQIVTEYLDRVAPETIWDLGANVGVFSRLASDRGIPTVAFDVDPGAVERNYLRCVEADETNLLPLLLDLTNPSPGIGWENRERTAWLQRGPVDTVFALALVHHLAISNNLPLERIAGFFDRICSSLIIEFVPKSDSQVQKLLSTREDIFPNYTKRAFEDAFGEYFSIQGSAKIRDSERTVYLMVNRTQI